MKRLALSENEIIASLVATV